MQFANSPVIPWRLQLPVPEPKAMPKPLSLTLGPCKLFYSAGRTGCLFVCLRLHMHLLNAKFKSHVCQCLPLSVRLPALRCPPKANVHLVTDSNEMESRNGGPTATVVAAAHSNAWMAESCFGVTDRRPLALASLLYCLWIVSMWQLTSQSTGSAAAVAY